MTWIIILIFSFLAFSIEIISIFVSSEAQNLIRAFNGMEAHPAYFEELEGDDGWQSGLYETDSSAMAESSEQLSIYHERSHKVVNVEDYGAKAGGIDSTMAFAKAWNAACSATSTASLLIPAGNTYLLKPITFSGPCKSDVSVMIRGTIEASSDPSDWNGKNQRQWIVFNSVNNLAVSGGGNINGNGKVWWQKSCKIDESQPCKDAPTALTFNACNGLTVEGLNLINSQQIHMEVGNSMNVMASGLTITAPSESPNTDGIHITGTRNITVANCTIATGDDCISIVTGSEEIEATKITCGPGHGISIGSLGENGSTAEVSGVTVDGAQFSGTSNGVRIKTWQGGRGYVKNIVFKNIEMNNVENPIIIDQHYCDSKKPCAQQNSTVKISNVKYYKIKGTSASDIAINFNCSKSAPCSGITLQDIKLVKNGGASAKISSVNALWVMKGTVIPAPRALIKTEIILVERYII